EMLGTILVAVVVRELAPLVTAIVVTGRSGTAIATELGNMKANSEVAALASMGIDPAHYIVLPRLIGATVSVLVLTVYFAFVAILGGYAVSLLIASPSFTAIQAGASRTLMLADLPLFLAKAGGLGALVGWLPCHYGLSVKSSPTEVPQQASRAVVRCMGACVAYNLVVTAGFYAWVGPPIR
ncbi:MAG TPA: ABC transporter permease, partial [Polyangiaceae bacterium]|nr:ABC transporter permease [Polyangiaceae bacterium]